MSFINNLFKEKDDNYSKAKLSLKNIKKKFDGFCISFPDVTPNEIMFLKDRWESLPSKLGKGVKIMALNFTDGLRTFLTDYSTNSFIKPHRHVQYEYGKVIKGSVVNRLNGEVYNVGDEYKFYPNEVHYLMSNKQGSVVYSVLTEKGNHSIGELNEGVIELVTQMR